jgi:hypothetical protein
VLNESARESAQSAGARCLVNARRAKARRKAEQARYRRAIGGSEKAEVA